jgi:ankyrin repeat protein
MVDTMSVQLSSEFVQSADAIINGDLESLKALIQDHPDLIHARSTLEHHSTLLFYVSANSVEDERQRTPDNILEITEFLLEQGADPNVMSDAYGGNATLLGSLVSSTHPAHANKQADLVKLLCRYGATPNIHDNAPLKTAIAFRYPKAVDALIACGAPIDHVVFASAVGDIEQVKAFIQAGVKPYTTAFSIDVTDKKEVLGIALTAASMMGHVDVVSHLLTQDIDINAKMSDEKGTALHEASITGQVKVAELLLQHGADVSSQDYQGFTPLHLAAWHQQHDMIDLLIQHDAPLEVLNAYGGTALDTTVYGFVHGYYPIENPLPTLQQLIDAGADVQNVSPFPTGHNAIDTLLSVYRTDET